MFQKSVEAYNLGNKYIPSENKQGISTFRIIRFVKIRAFLKSTSNLRSFATKLALLSLSVQGNNFLLLAISEREEIEVRAFL